MVTIPMPKKAPTMTPKSAKVALEVVVGVFVVVDIMVVGTVVVTVSVPSPEGLHQGSSGIWP